MKLPTTMEFDERTSTVTIRHMQTRVILFMVKLEAGYAATMSRIDPTVDCDNFWMGVKPADSLVFSGELFGRELLVVDSIAFRLE